MTPKEKAIEFIDKFEHETYSLIQGQLSKQCALIAVDEIINTSPTNPLKSGYIELYSDMVDEAIIYWQEVKKEIEAL